MTTTPQISKHDTSAGNLKPLYNQNLEKRYDAKSDIPDSMSN